MGGKNMTVDELKAIIRTIPDFPKPGIQFRDITTLIGHGQGFSAAVAMLAERSECCDAVAGIEARGFIFGAALARELGVGFVPLRKRGKLPVTVIGIDYALEYGTDRLELDPGAAVGRRIILVDDLIATGGTALAGARLLREAGAAVEQALFVIDLPDLGGADRVRAERLQVETLLAYAGH